MRPRTGSSSSGASAGRTAPRRAWVAPAVVVAVVMLAAAVVWAVRFSSLLDTREVEVTGAAPAVVTDVVKAVGPADRRPLAAADLEAIGRRAAAVPAVDSVRVSRSWPHTLRVVVTPRVPVLAVSQAGGVRLYDRRGVGYATEPAAPAGVPVVEAGEAADGVALAGAVSMMAALPAELRRTVTGVTVSSVSAMGFTVGKTTVRWGDASRPDLKVKVLRALLAEKPQVIDVSAPEAPATS